MTQKRVFLAFDSAWILDKKDDEILPVEALVNRLKERCSLEVLDTSLTDCELLVKGEGVTEEQIKSILNETLKEIFSIDLSNDAVELTIGDYTEEKPAASPKEAEKPAEEKHADVPVLDEINALIGAEEFKALARECVQVAPALKKYDTADTFTHQSYLFSINDGYGLSTYLKLFARLLGEQELLRIQEKSPVAELKIHQPKNGEIEAVFAPILSHLQRSTSKGGQVVCVDISEWMTKTRDKEFKEFLSNVYDRLGEHIIVFRVPFVEMEILEQLNSSIGDVLSVRNVSFIPFDTDQLVQYAEKELTARGFSVEPDAWDVFRCKLTEEKNDGRFYGINTVEKIVREMIYRKQLDNAVNGVDDTIVKKAEIRTLTKQAGDSTKSGIELLDDFVGMEKVKERVIEIVTQIEVASQNAGLAKPCIHMRFLGNPGTGKTTIARVIGQILKEKGILRNGSFFEYSGRDLCGRYVGETAPKTAAICRDAYGSVLFIDEAYTLYRDGFRSDYGQEAVDTLIAEMENHRSDLVVIMAGYPDDMKNLMKANSGLESRMPYVLEFSNYTREELFAIYMQMANKRAKCREGLEEAVKAYFDSLPDEMLSSKEFSNARFVRNLFERTCGKAILRSQFSKNEAIEITKEDFELASSEKEFVALMKKRAHALGFA